MKKISKKKNLILIAVVVFAFGAMLFCGGSGPNIARIMKGEIIPIEYSFNDFFKNNKNVYFSQLIDGNLSFKDYQMKKYETIQYKDIQCVQTFDIRWFIYNVSSQGAITRHLGYFDFIWIPIYRDNVNNTRYVLQLTTLTDLYLNKIFSVYLTFKIFQKTGEKIYLVKATDIGARHFDLYGIKIDYGSAGSVGILQRMRTIRKIEFVKDTNIAELLIKTSEDFKDSKYVLSKKNILMNIKKGSFINIQPDMRELDKGLEQRLRELYKKYKKK